MCLVVWQEELFPNLEKIGEIITTPLFEMSATPLARRGEEEVLSLVFWHLLFLHRRQGGKEDIFAIIA